MLEQMDGGDCVRHIFVSHREVGCVRHLATMGVGHLVKAYDRHPAAGEPPREVLEWLVLPAGLIPVERPSSTEQYNPRPGTTSTRQADRARDGQWAGAD